MLGHCARIRADPSAYRRILPGRFGCGAPDHLRIEVEPADLAADQPGQRCGELAVAAAEVEQGHIRDDATPAERRLGLRPQCRPPVEVRHRGGGERDAPPKQNPAYPLTPVRTRAFTK